MNFGKMKIFIWRVRDYLSWAQFLMVSYLFLQNTNLPIIPVMFLVFICVIGIVYIDQKVIYPGELKYNTEKNPYIWKLRRQIEEIHTKVCNEHEYEF